MMKEAIAIDKAQRGNDYTVIDNTGYTPVVRTVQLRTYTPLAPEFVDSTNGETEQSRVGVLFFLRLLPTACGRSYTLGLQDWRLRPDLDSVGGWAPERR